jgi:hypothetical protein
MRRVRKVVGLSFCAVLSLLVGAAAPASAHGDDESDQSRVLVQQAIALIVNTPDDAMGIEDKVNDALKASDTMGADLDMVKQAMDALDAGDMMNTRTLLQTAIGAGPYLGEGMPPAVGETTAEPGTAPYAVGVETGTTVVYDELDPGADIDGGDVVLIALSALTILGGLALAWRFRPEDTIRRMVRGSAKSGGSE